MGWMGKVWQGAAHTVLGPLLTAGAAPLQAGPRWAHHGQTHALHCHPLQHCLPITDTHLCCCLPAMQPLIITISLQRHLLAAMLSALQSACSATAPKCVSSSSQRWEVAAQGGGRAGSREGCGGGSAGRRHCRQVAVQGNGSARQAVLQGNGTAGRWHCRAAALRADGSAAVRPGGASHTPRALPAALSCMHGTGGGHGGCTAPCAAHCHGPSPAALPPLPPPARLQLLLIGLRLAQPVQHNGIWGKAVGGHAALSPAAPRVAQSVLWFRPSVPSRIKHPGGTRDRQRLVPGLCLHGGMQKMGSVLQCELYPCVPALPTPLGPGGIWPSPAAGMGWEGCAQPPLPPPRPWRDSSRGAGGLGARGCSAQQRSGLGMLKDKARLDGALGVLV